jgi:hypothetical protein
MPRSREIRRTAYRQQQVPAHKRNRVARSQCRPKSLEPYRPPSDAVWFTRARSFVRPNRSHAVHSTVKSRATLKCQLPLSRSTAPVAMAVPDLTSFSGVQLNAQVLLPICKDNRMISIRQLTFEKSTLVFATRLKCRSRELATAELATAELATVSKTPDDLMHQFQNLEELYQELLALRIRVRQAERANARRTDVGPKTKTGNPARRKQLAHKRTR